VKKNNSVKEENAKHIKELEDIREKLSKLKMGPFSKDRLKDMRSK